MKTKAEIVKDWLPRYTGRPLASVRRNTSCSRTSSNYVELFAERFGVEVIGRDQPMQSATAEDITILNFGMGSAMAATVMDLLSAVSPKAVLFLGKCGGFKKTKVGDFILPIAAIRGEGTSNDYLPPEIPALPSFRLQKAVSAMIVQAAAAITGPARSTRPTAASGSTTTSSRSTSRTTRVIGIDMETATIFVVGFVNHIPKGALLLVSDNPMTPEGVKTTRSDKAVTEKYRASAPGDRHPLADRAARLGRVGEASAVRVRLGTTTPDIFCRGRGFILQMDELRAVAKDAQCEVRDQPCCRRRLT